MEVAGSSLPEHDTWEHEVPVSDKIPRPTLDAPTRSTQTFQPVVKR